MLAQGFVIFSYFMSLPMKLINLIEFKRQKFLGYNERAHEYAFVFDALKQFWPETILDVGTGKTALPALMKNTGASVTALDNISDYWGSFFFNKYCYVVDESILNHHSQYDAVTCISVLEHISDYDSAISAMVKNLKPSGILILTTPFNSNQNFCKNVYELKKSNAKGRNIKFETHSFNSKNISDWCAANNLELVKDEYWKFFEGNYWSEGIRLPRPQISAKDQPHQLGLFLFRKR